MKLLKLLASVAASLAAGVIGTLATIPNIPTWYAGLSKPPFLPPNWVFAPVWTTLYILMGASLFIIWIYKTKKSKNSEYLWFGAQLVFNALWSIVFFGLHQPWLGVVVILLLFTTIVICIVKFKKISQTAAMLLIPYLAWVSFATYLTLGVAVKN